jgi:hypothetical protein
LVSRASAARVVRRRWGYPWGHRQRQVGQVPSGIKWLRSGLECTHSHQQATPNQPVARHRPALDAGLFAPARFAKGSWSSLHGFVDAVARAGYATASGYRCCITRGSARDVRQLAQRRDDACRRGARASAGLTRCSRCGVHRSTRRACPARVVALRFCLTACIPHRVLERKYRSDRWTRADSRWTGWCRRTRGQRSQANPGRRQGGCALRHVRNDAFLHALPAGALVSMSSRAGLARRPRRPASGSSTSARCRYANRTRSICRPQHTFRVTQ